MHCWRNGSVKKFPFLLILIVIFAFVFYNLSEEQQMIESKARENSFVKKVTDGDTVELINGTKIRLYGINSQEKGFYLSKEAKDFLESVLDGKLELEYFGKDMYNRSLAILYANNTNVNLMMVRNGLATVYMTEKDDFKQVEEEAKASNLGLWEKSNVNCVKITEIQPKEEYLVMRNNCSDAVQMKGWMLKDDGRKTLIFSNFSFCVNCDLTVFSGNGTNAGDEIYWGLGDVWNDDGDRAFLRDEKGLLIDVYDYKK